MADHDKFHNWVGKGESSNSGTADTSSGCSNVFNNDGSFLERFKKLQEEKKEERSASSSVKLPPLIKPGKKVLTKRKGFLPQVQPSHSLDPPVEKKSKETLSESSQDTPTNLTTTTSGIDSTSPPITPTISDTEATPTPKRKRKSRWGEAPSKEDQQMIAAMSSFVQPVASQQATLTAEQQQQILEQQEMNRLVQQVQSAANQRRGSKLGSAHAEDIAMEAWQKEHKQRKLEMEKTTDKASDLTEAGKGKHFIGDFLPPDELAKFMERVKAIKEGRKPDVSDYAENKLTDDNVGYQLLQKAGWKEGAGLGKAQEGITTPIDKGKQSFDQAGLGANPVGEIAKEDDQFDVYRKRMMLAYKFRPNPLNNPRRPYY